LILDSTNLNLTVLPSLSDRGLCTTLNGNSIIDTFHDSNPKMKDFIEILGNNQPGSFKAMKIHGSGHSHQKLMWLNVKDVTSKEITKGSMNVAINDWKDYVSVR
jgi:hypothetical protein